MFYKRSKCNYFMLGLIREATCRNFKLFKISTCRSNKQNFQLRKPPISSGNIRTQYYLSFGECKYKCCASTRYLSTVYEHCHETDFNGLLGTYFFPADL